MLSLSIKDLVMIAIIFLIIAFPSLTILLSKLKGKAYNNTILIMKSLSITFVFMFTMLCGCVVTGLYGAPDWENLFRLGVLLSLIPFIYRIIKIIMTPKDNIILSEETIEITGEGNN